MIATFAFALVVLLVLGLGAYAVNRVDTHKNSGTEASGKCVACHGNKAVSRTLDPNVLSAHRLHLRSPNKVLRFRMFCNRCHISTDEVEESGASLRKQVSSDICLRCHGTFRTTGISAHNGVSPTDTTCLNSGCHNSRAEVRRDHRAAKAPVTSKAARIEYCSKCHGGLPLFAVEETNPATW